MPPSVAEIPCPPMAIIEQGLSMLDLIDSNNFPASIDVPKLGEHSKQPNEAVIINVDAFEYEDILKRPTMSAVPCEGHTIIFPDGKSPHTTYPFALHNTIALPWDYALKNGVMKLFVCRCHGLFGGSGAACQPCRQLVKNETLENILTWIENGAHENARFAYHGFSSLQEMLHRKKQLIEFY